MCGKLWGKVMTFVLALLKIMPACAMTGCSGSKEPVNKTSVDYTVVENADLPEELKKLIESKKDKVMRLTYTTKDYTYVVAGYGTRETSVSSPAHCNIRQKNNKSPYPILLKCSGYTVG